MLQRMSKAAREAARLSGFRCSRGSALDLRSFRKNHEHAENNMVSLRIERSDCGKLCTKAEDKWSD